MHAVTFFYAITLCRFNIMFQRIFRHTKHEAYHADHEDEEFPESRKSERLEARGGVFTSKLNLISEINSFKLGLP